MAEYAPNNMFDDGIIAGLGSLSEAFIIPASLFVVIITLWGQRRIAKCRATLDIMLKEQSDPSLLAQRKKFTVLRNSGTIEKYALPEHADSDEATTIRSILNFNELIAIGISKKTVDAEIYKRFCRTAYVDDWIGCKPFVMELRGQGENPTYYYCEIQGLAKRWAKEGELKHF